MSRLLLESGPPDALALEDGSGVVLLEDVDAALERRDPLYVRIDRPNWRISWTAGFQVNLHGAVVAATLPVGRALTERPSVSPYYRTWEQNLQQSTLAVAPAPVGQRVDALPPQAAPLQLNQRTWLFNYNSNLIAQDRMAVGAKYTDRPPVPPYYRDWAQNLLQRTLHPLPPGIEFTERPPVPPWYRTWAVTLQQSTLAPAPVPFAQLGWPLTPAPLRASNLGTWTAKYNENLVGKDQRVAGQTITDRPPVPPFYRTWSENLLERTLAPAPPRPVVGVITELPPRDHQRAIALRTWINVGVPQEMFPSFVTGWDIGKGVDWRRSWAVNLLQTTLAAPAAVPFAQDDWPLPRAYPFGPDLRTWTAFYNRNLIAKDALPVGSILTARPPVPPFYRSLTVALTYLLPPGEKPFAQQDWPLPTPQRPAIQLRTWKDKFNVNLIGKDQLPPGEAVTDRSPVPPWYRDWSVNLQQTTLFTAAQKPIVQTDWPLTPAALFAMNLRTWAEKYNPNLIAQDRLPTGVELTDRPPVPPFYRDWSVNLQQTTLRPRPVGLQVTDLPPRDHQRSIQLRTWLEKYNANLIGKDRLPTGYVFTARPPVPPWYRFWFVNLSESTLAPEVFPLPLNQYFWPLPQRRTTEPTRKHDLGFITIPPVPVPRSVRTRRDEPGPYNRSNEAEQGRSNLASTGRSNTPRDRRTND